VTFTESNTVEAYLYDLLSGPAKSTPANVVREPEAAYGRSHKDPSTSLRTGLGWRRVASADYPRQPHKVLVGAGLREESIRLSLR